MKSPRLLWLDLETTGLRPEDNEICEIAIFVANFDRPFNVSAEPNFEAVFRVLDWDVDPFVLAMHRKSGLVEACFDATADVRHAEDAMIEHFVGAFPKPEENAAIPEEQKLVLAGSSVDFDLAFLREHMPDFASYLSHRVYDVSALKLFCRSIGMPKPDPKPETAHRAKADVLASIRDAKACLEWLAAVPPSGEMDALSNAEAAWCRFGTVR